MEKSLDKELGCVWGAILGDVIGSHVQNDKALTKEKIQKSFTICGGGIRKLERGQPTDDSQLTLAVGKGLVAGKGTLNLNLVAQQMSNWFLSKPIDVGNTIRNSVPKACNMKEHQAHLVRKGATQKSQTSQSNGTLMCISGMAVWCKHLKPEDIEKAVRQFTILIHPNPTITLVNTFYTLCIIYMLNNPNNPTRNLQAFEQALIWSKTKNNPELNEWLTIVQQTSGSFEELIKVIPPEKASGWAKIAFCYALHFLLAGEQFKAAIQKTISVRGDTDTNACIVGALLGAYLGVDNMDMNEQIGKISQFKGKVYKRPDWMIPGIVMPGLVEKLTQYAPKELKMIGNSQ